MRFWAPLLAVFASVALAQSQQNAILVPAGQSTLQVTAGQPVTITWSNPSSGTVTIKLQQFNGLITPDTGRIIQTGIPASAQIATFTLQPEDVNSFQYVIEIIDDSNPQNYNFSPNFGIQGATGTSTAIISSAIATGSSASATGSSTSGASSSASASSESAAASSSSASSASESSASATESSSASRTSDAATETTSAPSAGGAANLKAQMGLMAVVAGAVLVL